jgi:hypothetical protein
MHKPEPNVHVLKYRLHKPAVKYCNRVLGLLCLLMVITYLDRVCIAVAGPRMQEALHIGTVGWGWVTGVFTLTKVPHGLPWRMVLRSGNFWSAMGVALCYVYTYYFFQSWFHTYLVKARGYTESDLFLSSLPYVVGACANCAGGFASHALVKQFGLTWGRRVIGVAGLSTAALCAVASVFTQQWLAALILLSLVYGGITFQQPIMFAVCLDIGGEYAGAVVGAMNTSAQVGSFASSLAFGYLVERYGSYNVPFIPMVTLLLIGAWLWLKVDPSQRLVEGGSFAAPGPGDRSGPNNVRCPLTVVTVNGQRTTPVMPNQGETAARRMELQRPVSRLP